MVGDQRPADVRREHRHLALGEVDHLGRLVDQDQRERERAVDRALREPETSVWKNCCISSRGTRSAPRRWPSSSSAVPEIVSEPVSSTYARAAAASAIAAFCSTTSTARPFLLVQVGDDLEHLARDQRGEPERRLVEHQQPRPLQERAGEREHLLLAARERARLLVAPRLEPREVVEHRVEIDPPARACTRPCGGSPRRSARRRCRDLRERERFRRARPPRGRSGSACGRRARRRRSVAPSRRPPAAWSSCRRRSRRGARRSRPRRRSASLRAARRSARSGQRRR